MGGDAARCVFIDLGNDRLPHAFHIAKHFVVPESQYSIALAAHEVVTP
jgi:hypothetical protein